MPRTRLVGKFKTAMLTSVAVSGATMFGSSCGVSRLQDSVLDGLSNFVETYTGDALNEFVPAPGDVLGDDDADADAAE